MVELWNFLVNNQSEVLAQTLQHLWLTFSALFIAVLVGIPLAIACTRYRRLAKPVMGFVGVIQTIPSIALLGFMIPLLGIGAVPAIVALFLYALLPIVRNTYAGIDEVAPTVVEAARGMGMTANRVLTKVELPLALPVIFAGIRTATVINVGVATLCALIGAGGLGAYIFRGIALNNTIMILAGAIPAALLAIFFDNLLGLAQRHIRRYGRFIAAAFGVIGLVAGIWVGQQTLKSDAFRAGVGSEFLERPDGYRGLEQAYNFEMPTVEMSASLMYQALKNKRIDAAIGYSTDGRIKAFKLAVLKDDKNYFPPYDAAPLVRQATLREHPQLKEVLNMLAATISTQQMISLNNKVDMQQQPAEAVAKAFLDSLGYKTSVQRSGSPDIIIGGKQQTEQFTLGQMYVTLIENYTSLDAELKAGLAGTQVVFNALTNGEIDLYPEYTGTGLYVLLKADSAAVQKLENNPQTTYNYVQAQMQQRFGVQWLQPIGFNNTYALLMRQAQADSLGIKSISDLATYLNKKR